MKTDLHNQYKDQPTTNLLMITQRPGLYHADLVAVVAEILKTREVTQEDLDNAEIQLNKVGSPVLAEALPVDSLKAANDKNELWLKVILAVVVLDYLHLLYIDIKQFSHVFSREVYSYRNVSVGSFFDLLVLPFVFYMFYKRKRWGWITLFAVKLITIEPSLLFYFREYWPVESGVNLLSYSLLAISINIAIIIVLWKRDICNVFKVNDRTKWVTALSILLALAILTYIGINNHASYVDVRSDKVTQTTAASGVADTSTEPQPKLLSLIKARNEKPLDTTYMATGFYFLEEDGKGINMREEKTNDIYTVARLPFASVQNITKTNFEKGHLQNGGEYTELCMTFNEKGTKAIAEATGNPLHPKIAVVIANKLLYVVENSTVIKTGVMCVAVVGYSEKEMEEMRKAIENKR